MRRAGGRARTQTHNSRTDSVPARRIASSPPPWWIGVGSTRARAAAWPLILPSPLPPCVCVARVSLCLCVFLSVTRAVARPVFLPVSASAQFISRHRHRIAATRPDLASLCVTAPAAMPSILCRQCLAPSRLG